jgi:hypothetical protein
VSRAGGARGAAGTGGVTATVQLLVRKGRTDARSWIVELRDGAVVRSEAGAPEGGEPDVVLAIAPDDVDAVRSGALPLSVGFMRGQVKVSGDPGALLRVLPLLDGDTFAPHRPGVLAS